MAGSLELVATDPVGLIGDCATSSRKAPCGWGTERRFCGVFIAGRAQERQVKHMVRFLREPWSGLGQLLVGGDEQEQQMFIALPWGPTHHLAAVGSSLKGWLSTDLSTTGFLSPFLASSFWLALSAGASSGTDDVWPDALEPLSSRQDLRVKEVSHWMSVDDGCNPVLHPCVLHAQSRGGGNAHARDLLREIFSTPSPAPVTSTSGSSPAIFSSLKFRLFRALSSPLKFCFVDRETD